MLNSRDLEELKSVLKWSLSEAESVSRSITLNTNRIIIEMDKIKNGEIEDPSGERKKFLLSHLCQASVFGDRYRDKVASLRRMLEKLN